MRKPAPADEAAESLTVLAIGMSARDVAEKLLACRPLPPRTPRVTKATVPAGKMAALQRDLLHNTPLPSDIFHDGRQYIDMFGDRFDEHPETEGAVERLLAELNRDIDLSNEAADAAAAQAEAEAKAYLATLA